MIKRGAGGGSVEVTFEVDPAVNAQRANLCGDFNDWNNDANLMQRRDDGGFTRAKIVFTESDERCGLTAELDGVKKEGVPLQLDLDQLEDAKTSAGARAQLKEALRLYFRRVQGK